jgi:hypothetical protein
MATDVAVSSGVPIRRRGPERALAATDSRGSLTFVHGLGEFQAA